MAKFRIIETYEGSFFAQRKGLIFWKDLNPYDPWYEYRPALSIHEAMKVIENYQKFPRVVKTM